MNPLMMAMQNAKNPTGNMMGVLQLLKSGNPEQIARQMMQNNPQFRQFIEANRGKTPEQVARENGIDLDRFKHMI